MPEANVLYFHTLTGMHPGSGTALGVVDLPIQRERHTQWPIVPGSSIKGVLRDVCRRAEGSSDTDVLQAVFGPERIGSGKENEAFAGALSCTDARILAFPVRSIRGVFAWVTCPAVLQRLGRDLALAGKDGFPAVPSVQDNEALARKAESPLVVDEKIVLEEFDFAVKGECGPIADWLARNAFADEADRTSFGKRLVVLSDNDFTHFVRYATEVVARIGLDYEKKTVKTGALFYQEFLPAETLLYGLVIAEDGRKKGHSIKAAEVLTYLRKQVEQQKVLQIGGDETIGKGLCRVRFA